MSEDLIGYTKLLDTAIDSALRGVVRDILKQVQNQGLSGDHHFYLTFRTNFPGVLIAETLKSRYPEEMTIVIQHQFWNLKVEEKFFSIVLSFNKIREKLIIPFQAITGFVDPSVKFIMPLESHYTSGAESLSEQLELTQVDDVPARSAEIISLDSFRKKQP